MNVEDKVREILIEFLGAPTDFSTSSTFETLGSDSLAMMEVIMEVEDSFGIEVSDEIVENLQTPKDLINFLDKE